MFLRYCEKLDLRYFDFDFEHRKQNEVDDEAAENVLPSAVIEEEEPEPNSLDAAEAEAEAEDDDQVDEENPNNAPAPLD